MTLQISDWLQIDFRLASDSFQTGSLKNCKNFRFQISSDWFRVTLQISDWNFRSQIDFRLLSDSFQTGCLKNRKNFRFQIGLDWFRLTLQISDRLYIGLGFISECSLKKKPRSKPPLPKPMITSLPPGPRPPLLPHLTPHLCS